MFFQDLKLLNNDLTPKAVIDVLAIDDPKVTDPDGAVNLELEVIRQSFQNPGNMEGVPLCCYEFSASQEYDGISVWIWIT